MDNVWAVASGKGGTGKSTAAANLGAALAASGRRVLLVDLDLGLRCLDFCLGLHDRVLFDLMDVLEGGCRPCDAILAHPAVAGLHLLPASQSRSAADFDARRLQDLCGILSGEFDAVFLDCPPGIGPVPAGAAAAAGRGLLVTTPDPAAVRDADRMAAEFSAAGITEIYLVVNRFRSEFLQKGISLPAQEISAALGAPLLGTVPEDPAVEAATLQGEPVVLRQADSPAARIFTAMARRLPGKDFM